MFDPISWDDDLSHHAHIDAYYEREMYKKEESLLRKHSYLNSYLNYNDFGEL